MEYDDAIYGILQLVDQTIIFRIDEERGLAYVTVSDVTGGEESYTAAGRAFMAALSMAIDWDGGAEFPEDHKNLALKGLPTDPSLRFIP